MRCDDSTVVQQTTTTTRLAIQQLIPFEVTASSALNQFPPEALIDDNPDNRWNDDSQRGVGAVLTFSFAQPVQITQVVIQNVTNEESFRRNYRIERLEIGTDDLPINLVTLDDTMDPQTVDIASIRTSTVTFTVIGTYPGESFGGEPPYQELALQEVKFFGRIAQTP